jgi:DnaJ-class molecular chaperone
VKDPYQVLGVARSATEDEIKKTYRALARELHPDRNPGDAAAENRFKEVSAAYDFLSDSTRRAQYDAGEIDASGNARRSSAGMGGMGGGWGTGGWKSADSGWGSRSGFSFGDDADDILAEMMRRKERGRAQAQARPKAAETRHDLTVTFVEAALGASKRVTLSHGRTVDVKIPAGATEGQTLRLKGCGQPAGPTAAIVPDAFIDLHVEPHPFFVRRERDVVLDLPVSVQEAVLGAKITVPTLDGRVALTIPPGSNGGTVMRLKGKGIPAADGTRGDLLVTLRVMLPEDDAEFRKLVEKWGPRHGYDPRAKAGLG